MMQFTGFVTHPVTLRATTFHQTSLCPHILKNNRPITNLRRPVQLPHRPQPSATPMTMFSEDDGEDAETVELVDPDSGRRLTVGIEYQFEFEDVDYLMCFPVDDPVVIAYEEDEEMHELGEADELREMFPVAEQALADENIVLKDTAYWWTVDDLAEIEDQEDGEENSDEGEVLADFQFKGRQYSVVQPVFAVYMIAREGPDGFEPIQGDELERISPVAEQMWMQYKSRN